MNKFEKNLKKIIEGSTTIPFYQRKDAIESGMTNEELSYFLDQGLIEPYSFLGHSELDLIRPTDYGLSYFYGRCVERKEKKKQILLTILISMITSFLSSLLSEDFWQVVKMLIELSKQ